MKGQEVRLLGAVVVGGCGGGVFRPLMFKVIIVIIVDALVFHTVSAFCGLNGTFYILSFSLLS